MSRPARRGQLLYLARKGGMLGIASCSRVSDTLYYNRILGRYDRQDLSRWSKEGVMELSKHKYIRIIIEEESMREIDEFAC